MKLPWKLTAAEIRAATDRLVAKHQCDFQGWMAARAAQIRKSRGDAK